MRVVHKSSELVGIFAIPWYTHYILEVGEIEHTSRPVSHLVLVLAEASSTAVTMGIFESPDVSEVLSVDTYELLSAWQEILYSRRYVFGSCKSFQYALSTKIRHIIR